MTNETAPPLGEVVLAYEPSYDAPTRTDWVVERIRRAVLFGEVKPGERLVTATWASRLSLSATPIREAFQRLAAEGFVDFDPQRGARVAPLTAGAACEIYDLRIKLEPDAVASSVARGDDAWRRQLKLSFGELEEIYGTKNFGTAIAHRAFHQLLRSKCESVWMLRIADLLADQATRLQFSSLSHRGGIEAALNEHRALFDAALEGNAALAGSLTEAHLRGTLAALRVQTTVDF